MLVLSSSQEMQQTALRWKREHAIAFVPTMGCLHEGHLRLVRKARTLGKKCVVSIFVNPLQFVKGEDYEKYPRTLEADKERLNELEVDLLFAPTDKEFYRGGFQSEVQVSQLSQHLCGKSRPGHFRGVTTVCLKLFQITQADYAVFGEKDFQQLRVIQQMVLDLNVPLAIIPHEIVREEDGLAMSSRNRYLTPEQRRWAAKIPETVNLVRERAKLNPNVSVESLLELAQRNLTSVPLTIDYVEIASERTLKPEKRSILLSAIEAPHFFVAVKVGSTRLIDNTSLGARS